MKTLLIITIVVLALLALIYLIGRINLGWKFHVQVKQLFAGSVNISQRTFYQHQLVDLPEPVQRYFRHILKDGQPYISYARITHDGQFKAGLQKDWTGIKGEQYATTHIPGFIWKGVTAMFTARDLFIADKGRLVVALFSVFNVVDAEDHNTTRGNCSVGSVKVFCTPPTCYQTSGCNGSLLIRHLQK